MPLPCRRKRRNCCCKRDQRPGGYQGLQTLEERVCLGDAREQLFFGLKLGRVYTPAAAAQLYWMLQMEHFVINDVVEHVAGNTGMIEDPADDDGVVRGIVVAENAARFCLTPTHPRARHQTVEESSVELLEDGIEIVIMSARRAQHFAAAHLPDEVRLADDLVAADIFPVARRLSAVNGTPVHFRQQDVRNRAQNGFRRAFEQVREPHQQLAFPEPDRVVDIGEGEELDLQLGQGSAWPQFTISFLENFEQTFTHGESSVAGAGDQRLGTSGLVIISGWAGADKTKLQHRPILS